MSIDAVAYPAAAVVLAAVAVRIWLVRGASRRGEALVLALGALLVALAAVLVAPGSTALLLRLRTATGIDVAGLAGIAVRMAGAGVAGLLATYVRGGRPSPRAWVVGLVVVEAVLVTTYVAGSFATSPDGRHVTADPVAGVAFDLVRLAYPIVSLGLFLTALWPYARDLPRGSVRAGSRLLVAAAVVGIAWTAWTLDDVLDMARTGRQTTVDDWPSVVLELVFVATAGAGMTVTMWERVGSHAGAWWRVLRTHRAMAPLWVELCGDGARSAGGLTDRLAVSPWRVPIARYRRVIEIRDAQLALRPYLPPAEPSTTEGPVTPAAEARAISAALTAYAEGRRTGPSGPSGPGGAVDLTDPGSMARGIEAEAEHLAAVACELVLLRG